MAAAAQGAKVVGWASSLSNDRTMPCREPGRFSHESIAAVHHHHDSALILAVSWHGL